MLEIDRKTLNECSEALAFLGNSLLATVRQTSDVGLSPEFWIAFPTFGSDEIKYATTKAGLCVAGLEECPLLDSVTDVSVEYTHLFVGPPKPAAPPWETMHRGEGIEIGFGAATHEMRELLRAEGLHLQNENNQYEDHMGIELLFASVLCGRAARAEADEEAEALLERTRAFVVEHPLSWMGSLRAAVDAEAPNGYYAALLGVAEALLHTL